MNKVSIVLILVFMMLFSVVVNAYDDNALENYLTYRIKYIHSSAYNTSKTLATSRAREYAKEIIYWSHYYSNEIGTYVDPLLVSAIIEAETNFVSRDDYDGGISIGVSSMRIDTAKDIARELGEDYNKWRMLDATDLGIRFTVHYIARAYEKFEGNIERIIISYNRGYRGADNRDLDELYIPYLFNVLGRYKFYKERLNDQGVNAAKHFEYKVANL